jgi:hypothetical protein
MAWNILRVAKHCILWVCRHCWARFKVVHMRYVHGHNTCTRIRQPTMIGIVHMHVPAPAPAPAPALMSVHVCMC